MVFSLVLLLYGFGTECLEIWVVWLGWKLLSLYRPRNPNIGPIVAGEMGFLSTILGLWGFGVGTSIGLVIGYYMFIYFQPTDVKVSVFLPFVPLCLPCSVFLAANLGFHWFSGLNYLLKTSLFVQRFLRKRFTVLVRATVIYSYSDLLSHKQQEYAADILSAL